MHELSVCNALLEQVRATALANRATQVGQITVRLGALCGVEADLLEHAFTIARAGPMTADATLVIESIPIRIRCRDCGHENPAPPNHLLCAACNSYRVDLVSGEEMLLARVELKGVGDPRNQSNETEENSHV
jgi:hydrogenase nickel incorporation protein HypA/HybF